MEQHLSRGQQWLEQVLSLMGMPAAVKVDSGHLYDSDACWLTIDDSQLQPLEIDLLIGEQGKTIDAIQYLANALLNIKTQANEQQSYTIEINGYRVQRYAELKEIAEQAAKQVRETGEEIGMEPLSSAERRQVHSFLQDYEDIITESRGQEPNRRLFVRQR